MYHESATRSHENIGTKYTKIIDLRELNVLNTVSPYEDLVQPELGNGICIITEFNLLSSIIQGPKICT